MPTKTYYVSHKYDDGSERGNGYFLYDCDYIEMSRYPDAEHQLYRCGGYRFPNIDIPKYSTIISAKITLYVLAAWDDPHLKIYGNKVANAEDFYDNQNIISTAERPRTTAFCAWNDDDLGTGWETKTALEDIIQELIGQTDWASGNAIALLFIGDVGLATYFESYSYEKIPIGDYKAKLEIEYVEPTCSDYGTKAECEQAGCYWYDSSCHADMSAFDCATDGKFNITKECIKSAIRIIIPEANAGYWRAGKVTGNWRVDNHDIVMNLPYISVRISPEILWDIYDRNVGGEVAGSISDYHMSIHVFHSNCCCEPTCEKGKYAQDVASRIIDGLLDVPVGFDIDDLRMRESEPSRGAHRISRVIIEGTIHIKRID